MLNSSPENPSDASLSDIHIAHFQALISPHDLVNNIPIGAKARETIQCSRKTIQSILSGADPRLLIVVGPCSIHDVTAALDYARRLMQLKNKVGDTLFIVMRVYFEKPRTTIGWKGLINDPHLDNSFAIEEGLHTGRQLLLDLANMGIATATEALDPIAPQYLQDLVSWSAIGARTSESQTHREMSSGLSTPLGFKNGTKGNLDVAFNAMQSVRNPHSFLGIDRQGKVAVVATKGNSYAHIILRGGGGKANYDAINVRLCEDGLSQAGLPQNIMIDTSHDNSAKDPTRQPLIINDVARQIAEGNRSIMGLMIESHIYGGNQPFDTRHLQQLRYGVSITDPCIDWDTTVTSLQGLREKIRDILPTRRTPCDV